MRHPFPSGLMDKQMHHTEWQGGDTIEVNDTGIQPWRKPVEEVQEVNLIRAAKGGKDQGQRDDQGGVLMGGANRGEER